MLDRTSTGACPYRLRYGDWLLRRRIHSNEQMFVLAAG